MSHTGRGWVTPAAAAAAVLLGIYLAGTGAVYFRPEGSSVAFWWPAAGLSVALVATMPRSWAPGLAVGRRRRVRRGQPDRRPDRSRSPWPTASANAAEALIAGLVLKDAAGHLVRLDPALRLRPPARGRAGGRPGRSALIGATAAAVLGDGAFLPTLRNLVASHTAATMVIVPVAMTWRHRTGRREPRPSTPPRWRRWSWRSRSSSVRCTRCRCRSRVLPFLVWAALRLDPRTVTLELLLSLPGGGPADRPGPRARSATSAAAIPLELAAPLVQGYILATALVALPADAGGHPAGRGAGRSSPSASGCSAATSPSR